MSGLRIAARLSTAGLTLAFAVAIGAGLGMLADRWLKSGWMVIIGALLGVVAGFRELFRAVAQASADQERLDAERRAERAQREQTDGPEGPDD